MSAHTPGRWHATGVDVWFSWGNLETPLARVVAQPRGRESDAEGLANAHLIAAAPDLYAALDAIMDADEAYGSELSFEIRQKARAALNRAEGRTP